MFIDTLPYPLGESVPYSAKNPHWGRAFNIPARFAPVGASPVDRYDNWRVRLVRNVSGVALLPSLVAIKDLTNGGTTYHRSCLGVANTEGARGWGVVDEFLPAAGVPNGDFFWLFEQGPVKAWTGATSADYNGDIAIGAPLITAATGSGVTDTAAGGRLANLDDSTPADATAAKAQSMASLNACNAFALEAKTANTTPALILIQLLGRF